MPDESENNLLREKVENWARQAFQDSAAPKYPFSLHETVETLFRLLHAGFEASRYRSLGRDVLAGIGFFLNSEDLTKLCVRAEPFAMALLEMVNRARFDALWKAAASRTPPAKPGLAAILKKDGLQLADSTTVSGKPEGLRGKPRFAEHVARVYSYRNPEAHEAHDWPPPLKNQIFESLCVFLVFAVAEYRQKIESVLHVREHRKHLENVLESYKKWENRFIDPRCAEYKPGESNEIDPLAESPATQDLTNLTLLPKPPKSAAIQIPDVLPLADLMNTHQRCVLLGEPGAGKTTSAEFIALMFARDLLNNAASGKPLPVYVELKNCAAHPGSRVIDKIAAQLGSTAEAATKSLKDSWLLLLDGLNEISKNERKSVRDQIEEVLTAIPTLRAIITSRREGFLNEFNLPVYNLYSLGDEQIHEFVERSLAEPSKATELVERLHKDSKLWSLCRNPWWLSKVTQLALMDNTALPKSRGKLLQKLTRAFFNREHSQVGSQTNNLKKENLLAHLAFETQKEGQVSFFAATAVKLLNEAGMKSLDVYQFVDEAQNNGLLVHADDGTTAFSHQIFQEYFAACELHKRWQVAVESGNVFQIVGGLEWSEPLRLFADLVGDHLSIARSIANESSTIAARIYIDGGQEDKELRDYICEQAYLQATTDHWVDGIGALAELDDMERLKSAITKQGEFSLEHQDMLGVLARGWKNRGAGFSDDKANRVAPVLIDALKQRKAGPMLIWLAWVTWSSKTPALTEMYLDAVLALDFHERLLTVAFQRVTAKEAGRASLEFGATCVRKVAEAGLKKAFIPYGLLLSRGVGVDRNDDAAARWLRKAAEGGNTKSLVVLGELLVECPWVQQNGGEAENWLCRAQEAGDARAHVILQEFERKVLEHRLPAEAGDTDEMEDLADLLLALPKFARETGEGEKWLRLAATSSEKAKLRLARRLFDGKGLARNPPEGEQLLRELAATKNQDAVIELLGRVANREAPITTLAEGLAWFRQLSTGSPGSPS